MVSAAVEEIILKRVGIGDCQVVIYDTVDKRLTTIIIIIGVFKNVTRTAIGDNYLSKEYFHYQ